MFYGQPCSDNSGRWARNANEIAFAEPGAYGRLILDGDGNLDAIVEAKEASPDQLAVRTCNSGVMAASSKKMFELLRNVTNDNAKGEFYLTDIVHIARAAGGTTKAVICQEDDVLGVNSKVELAQAETIFQNKRRGELLASGVTMIDPNTVWLSFDTEIAPDVEIEPNVVFAPGVSVASGARWKKARKSETSLKSKRHAWAKAQRRTTYLIWVTGISVLAQISELGRSSAIMTAFSNIKRGSGQGLLSAPTALLLRRLKLAMVLISDREVLSQRM